MIILASIRLVRYLRIEIVLILRSRMSFKLIKFKHNLELKLNFSFFIGDCNTYGCDTTASVAVRYMDFFLFIVVACCFQWDSWLSLGSCPAYSLPFPFGCRKNWDKAQTTNGETNTSARVTFWITWCQRNFQKWSSWRRAYMAGAPAHPFSGSSGRVGSALSDCFRMWHRQTWSACRIWDDLVSRRQKIAKY